MSLSPIARAVAGAFVVSGVVHLVRPQVFEPIVPPQLPGRSQLVVISGVAELACAAGLFVPQTRRVAGPAATALLAAVWPANLYMALLKDRAARRSPTAKNQAIRVATWARLPLQIPMMRATWNAAR